MTDQNNESAGGQAGQGNNGTAENQPPRISVVTQYIKDLSFENPHSPQGLKPDVRPEIQISVDTKANKIDDTRYEVILDLKANAKAGEQTLFVAELSYGGLFSLTNIPAESLPAYLYIECPRTLFPFARRIIADSTRDGGLPPLLIDPVDFVALFRNRIEQAKASQQQQSAPA